MDYKKQLPEFFNEDAFEPISKRSRSIRNSKKIKKLLKRSSSGFSPILKTQKKHSSSKNRLGRTSSKTRNLRKTSSRRKSLQTQQQFNKRQSSIF